MPVQPVPRQSLMYFLLPFPGCVCFRWDHIVPVSIVWFLSLGSVILKFLLLSLCQESFLFVAEQFSVVWLDTILVSTHLLKDIGILANLSLLQIMRSEYPHMCLHVGRVVSFLLDK